MKVRYANGISVTIIFALSAGLVFWYPRDTGRSDIQRDVMVRPYYELGFSTGNAAQTIVRSAIGSARKSIVIAAESLSSQNMAEALVAAKSRGMHVRVVVNARNVDPTAGPFQALASHGIEIRTTGQAGAFRQFLLIDGVDNESGSVVLGDADGALLIADLGLAIRYRAEWQRLWEHSVAVESKGE
ncbi:phospholipase D-like domain-containing protein (plasmid) [Burkholderia aenigmatica]|uniref:phospholipase D-like domain-containing protein n=1 Tax=Burkholderia aenigmatica TaxID=2015348 RepID=UPI003B42B904